MSDSSKRDGAARRGPDNVTKIRKGGYALAVSGYYKVDSGEIVLDKMTRCAMTRHFQAKKLNLYLPVRTCGCIIRYPQG